MHPIYTQASLKEREQRLQEVTAELQSMSKTTNGGPQAQVAKVEAGYDDDDWGDWGDVDTA